jgi:hypothetical protein
VPCDVPVRLFSLSPYRLIALLPYSLIPLGTLRTSTLLPPAFRLFDPQNVLSLLAFLLYSSLPTSDRLPNFLPPKKSPHKRPGALNFLSILLSRHLRQQPRCMYRVQWRWGHRYGSIPPREHFTSSSMMWWQREYSVVEDSHISYSWWLSWLGEYLETLWMTRSWYYHVWRRLLPGIVGEYSDSDAQDCTRRFQACGICDLIYRTLRTTMIGGQRQTLKGKRIKATREIVEGRE